MKSVNICQNAQKLFKVFLNYQTHKVGISVNILPFISFVKFIVWWKYLKFGGKRFLNLLIIYHILQELVCWKKYKNIKLKLKYKNTRSTYINIANIV